MLLSFGIAYNGQVLLQVGYFIRFRPELLPGFNLNLKLRTFAWLYSSSRNCC